VRRASITTALNSLEEKQALRCQRSHVCIRDRNVLVFEADGFYGTGEDLYADSMLQV
jgi:hypothetical protein